MRVIRDVDLRYRGEHRHIRRLRKIPRQIDRRIRQHTQHKNDRDHDHTEHKADRAVKPGSRRSLFRRHLRPVNDLHTARFGDADDLRRRNRRKCVRNPAGKLRIGRSHHHLQQLRVRNDGDLHHTVEIFSRQCRLPADIRQNGVQDGIALQNLRICRSKALRRLQITVIDRIVCGVARAVVNVKAHAGLIRRRDKHGDRHVNQRGRNNARQQHPRVSAFRSGSGRSRRLRQRLAVCYRHS